ncbi:MAG: DUF4833 domain-containing protein [Bacteroidetes bacterium]|nr:DUF4833 domain-containing protein [Bacteroidota bacterium]
MRQFLFIRFFFLSLICSFNLFGQHMSFPTPTGNPKQLFYLQRTTNTNTIVCELNFKDSTFDKKDPVRVFWIRYEEKGQEQELDFFQKKFAYGIKVKPIDENSYEMHFVSFKKMKMYLMKAEDEQFRVFIDVNQKRLILHSIYIDLIETKKVKPNIQFLEITGTDLVTKKVIKERLNL